MLSKWSKTLAKHLTKLQTFLRTTHGVTIGASLDVCQSLTCSNNEVPKIKGDMNGMYEDSEDGENEDDIRKPAAQSSVDANTEPEEFDESSIEGDY